MNRIPRWLRIVLVVVAVLLLLALVVPYFLDVDRYRPQIVAAVEEATGRPFSIAGIRARLLPSVGFVLEDVRFGNPRDFPEGHLVTAESVRGNLALLPLLNGEYQLDSVEIVRPQVFLLEDRRGRTNYDLDSPKPSGGAGESEQAAPGVAFDSLLLTDAALIMGRAENPEAPLLRATGINARLEDVVVDAERLRNWKVEADLDGVRLDIAGLAGPIEFRSGSFRLAEGAVTTTFAAEVGEAGSVEGTLRVPDVQEVLAEFELTAPVIEADRLFAASGETAPAAGSRRPQPTTRELKARGRISVEQLRWAPYEFTGASAEVRVFGDRIEVSPVKAAVYDGALELAARINRTARGGFTARAQLSGLNMARLLAEDPSTREKMTGTGELQLNLAGPTDGDVADGLTGSGDFAIRDGRFPGFDLTKAMSALSRLQRALNLGNPQEAGGGETTFRVLQGDLNIRQRRVASRQILLDSSQGTVALQGSVGFDGALDYQGRAELTASAEGGRSPADLVTGALGKILKQDVGGLSVPFALRGTLENPRVQPGRGLPRIRTSQPQQQDEEKKKSIFDLFRPPQ